MLIVAHRFIINIDSYLMTVSYTGTLFKPLQSVYVKRYWLIIFIFINRQFNEIHKHRFNEMFGKFKNSSLLNSQIVRLQIPALTANTVPHTHP